METELGSWLFLPEGSMLVAVETEAAKGGLERGWKEGLGSACQGCAHSEEKAPGTARMAEIQFGQKRNSWRMAERQVGAELCSRNESLTVVL